MTFGTCLLFAGLHKEHQTYPIVFARTNAQLLVVSLISIILPTAFAAWSEDAPLKDDTRLVSVSHGCAIVLLLEFVSYIAFFYRTHAHAFHKTGSFDPGVGIMHATRVAAVCADSEHLNFLSPERLRSLRADAQDSKPRYPIYLNIVILIPGVTAQVFTSLYILESIESSAKNLHLSHSFVGLVMIPLILSSVEHITAVIRSQKEGLDWVTALAFGSCIRITLFVFPVAVLIGWMADMPGVTMIFDGFQVTILALTILLVNHVIQNHSLRW
jgi:Ca2+:H+ antiporter